MAEVLTGEPGIDDLIRQILGEDDEDDDAGGDWAGITELVEIFPTRLDGVSGPASGIPALMAKAGRRPVATRVMKANAAKRMTLHVAYPVDAVDRSRALDGARDFVKADALEAGAHEFMKAGAPIGTDHADGTTGAGTCLESWIHRAPPWSMTAVDGTTQTVHPGDWCVVVQWSPAAWSRFLKGDLDGVSMQGGAKRRKPPAAALAGVRKAAGKMPRCAKCQKKAKRADAKFCGKCGTAFGKGTPARAAKSVALAKAAEGVRTRAAAQGAAAADRAARLVKQARSADADVRDSAFSRLVGELGVEAAADLLAGNVTAAALGARVAKAAAADEMSRCKTCAGGGRLRHPATGKASRTCPSCQGSGEWTPDADEADMTESDASLVGQYAGQAKAGGPDAPDALGRLAAMLGPDVAVRLVSGEPVSPGDFRRGYLSACRAAQSGEGGPAPRIPDASHVPEASDFRRGPLTVRQSRPAPASAWPGSGGQWDQYQPGPGISPDPASASHPLPALAASTRR